MRGACTGRQIGTTWPVMFAFVVGCGGDGSGASGFVVSDSSGVRIVESVQPMGGEWRLGGDPELRIGSVDGPDGEQFTSIAGAWRQANGGLVVGDRLAGEIRFFHGDGTHRRSSGGSGEGPGEFQLLVSISPYRGDSIIAWDPGLKRLSVFDAHGELGRTRSIAWEALEIGEGDSGFGVMETFWGSFGDGSLVMSPMAFVFYHSGGSRAFARPILHASAEGEVLGPFEMEVLEEPPGQSAPFPRVATVGVAGEQMYAGSEEGHEIRISDASGLRSIVRVPGRVLWVGAEDRAEYARWYQETQREFGRSDQEIAERLEDTSFPSTLPPFSALVIDAEEHLWIQEYRLRSDSRPAMWNVFDPEGRWRTRVEMPAGLQVHQIGSDFVVGSRTDAFDVPFVEVYRLHRDEDGAGAEPDGGG